MNQAAIVEPALDTADLEIRVKSMYRDVATNPEADFHFEMGRQMAERLGYPAATLDCIPADAIASFAGVGYYFHLARMQVGETVVDLGSGSGMDAFFAATEVGESGEVIGIDMTYEQLQKAERLRRQGSFGNVEYRKGHIQSAPVADESADAVISNGVFNLLPDKYEMFGEVARILKPGGRLALADIVTGIQLPGDITCDATLWAACIGGAMQQNAYIGAIRASGLTVEAVEDNTEYRFISESARWATDTYQVKSISVLARKPA